MEHKIAKCYTLRNSNLPIVDAIALCYGSVMDVKQIRFQNFKSLLGKAESQRAFADTVGLAVAFVSQVNTKRRAVGDDAARRIEVALGLPRGWMDKQHDDMRPPEQYANFVQTPRNRGMVPLISWAQAATLIEAADIYEPSDVQDWLPCPQSHGSHTFALRVQGDSMTSPYPGQRSYPEGMLIYVDPDATFCSGRRVLAKLLDTDEVTFKVYVEDAGRRFLRPLNPQYPILELHDGFQILGVVIGSYLSEQ